MMDFFDKHLRGKKIDGTFDHFPSGKELDDAAQAAAAGRGGTPRKQ